MYRTPRLTHPACLTFVSILAAAAGCASQEHVSVQRIEPVPTMPASSGDHADFVVAQQDQQMVTTTRVVEPMSGEGSSMTASKPSAWKPGQKLEPFWISMTAEADRKIWDNQYKSTAPAETVALSATPTMKMPAMRGDESAEGLTHVTFSGQGADFDPCVSRDGTFMVFASTQHRPTSDIYMKSISGRTVTQLTSDASNDVMPCISPDGHRVAFCSNRNGNWDVYVMSAAGGQAVQITTDASPELHPTWSPDGKRLCFCRMGEVSGRWEMWVTDASSSGSVEFVGFGLFPEWCPAPATGSSGRDKILFQRSRERGDRAFSLWTVDYKPGDTSSPTEIVSCTNAAAINACWSPDGSRIVYATIDNPNDMRAPSSNEMFRMPTSNLWMTSIDGSQRVNLTSGSFMNLMPCWGSDSRIYFVSDRTGLPNIWSIGSDKAIMAATGKPAGKFTTDVAHGQQGHASGEHAPHGEVVNVNEGHEAPVHQH